MAQLSLDFEGLQYIDDLDELILRILKRFGGRTSAAERQFYDRLLASLGRFDVNAQGNLVKSAKNVRAINDVRRDLRQAALNPNYAAAVQGLAADFAAQAALLDNYFAAMRVGYRRSQAVYRAIVDEYIGATVAQLNGGALADVLVQPVTQVLQTHVTTGAPIQVLRDQVKAAVLDQGLVANHVDALVDNALNQFSRNYMQAVSDDLGLEHFFYKGTAIDTSRPFCKERVGKYYTLAEVLDWADLKYSGKIKGTDRTNIQTNLGGWRCRHRLVPITRDLYDAKKATLGK